MRNLNRRQILRGGAGALSTLLIRSIASGIPPAYLLNPTLAQAQAMPADIQTLILSTSSSGDPLNVNCPGSYVNSNQVENNPNLATATGTFGNQQVTTAEPWALLPADLRSRLAFFHYSPRTAAHPEYRATMQMKGSVKNEAGNGSEMFSSAMAQLGAGPLGTLQNEPIPLTGEDLTYLSMPLQTIKPVDLKELFTPEDQTLVDLRQTRDQVLDTLYADLQVSGNRAQRNFIDRYAQSRSQARELGEDLGALLNRLPTNEDNLNNPLDQIIAAVALAKLRISPVITIKIPFGGDNHQDSDLVVEATETTSGVGYIGTLWSELKAQGIQDNVSFATMNVFGRRSYRNSRGGRDHNQKHAVMVAFGSNIQGGVYGEMNGNGEAVAINGIQPDRTMEAAGRSMGRALGHSEASMNLRIPTGQLVPNFLRS